MFFSEFDPFAVSQHNTSLLKEISKRRLEKRLRDNRQPQSGRAHASIFQSLMHLPRWCQNALKRTIL